MAKTGKKRKVTVKRKVSVKKRIFKPKIPEPNNDLIRMNYEEIILINWYRLFDDQGIAVPAVLQQLREEFDCHLLKFNCGLRRSSVTVELRDICHPHVSTGIGSICSSLSAFTSLAYHR